MLPHESGVVVGVAAYVVEKIGVFGLLGAQPETGVRDHPIHGGSVIRLASTAPAYSLAASLGLVVEPGCATTFTWASRAPGSEKRCQPKSVNPVTSSEAP
jgi:hypothetical protein